MKKFTFLLFALLLSIGAKADLLVVSTSEENPEVVYAIKSKNNAYLGSNTYPVNDNQSAARFAFYKVDGMENTYYIYSITDSQWLGYNKSDADNTSTGKNKIVLRDSKPEQEYFYIENCGGDYVQISPYKTDGTTVAGLYLNYYGGLPGYGNNTIGFWTDKGSNDNGSAYLLETDNMVGWDNDVPQFSNDAVYIFVTKRGWMAAKDDNVNVVSTAYANNNLTASVYDDDFQWAVYKSENDKYYLYNIGKGLFMGVQTANNAAIPFVDSPAGYIRFKRSSSSEYPIMFSTDNNGVVNHSNNNNPGLINWTGGWNTLNDEGSNHYVMKVRNLETDELAAIEEVVSAFEMDNTQAVEQLDAAIARADEFKIGNGVGEYSVEEGWEAKLAAIKEYRAAIVSTKNPTVKEVDAKTAEVEALIASARLNMPTVGYYRIKAVSGWNDDAPYLGSNNSSAKTGRAEFVSKKDATTIFYYDGKYLLSYSEGEYLVSNDNFLGYNGVQSNGSAISFQASVNGLLSAYNIKFNDGTRALFVNQGNYTDAGSGLDNRNGYCFYLEAVESLPVEITSVGWASFYAPVAVTIPEGVTAYYLVSDSICNGYVRMTGVEKGKVLPAKAGVILSGAAGTYDFAISAKDPVDLSKNVFAGTVAATKVEDDAYVLGIVDDEVGLYLTSDYEKYKYFTNGSHKAYLPSGAVKPGASQSAGFTFDFSGTTGIDEVKSEAANTVVEGIFDLMGRRVENPTRGIYIVNGKRVFIK